MPTITRPAIIVPDDRRGIEEVITHYTARYPAHPRLADSLRVMAATGVETRAFATPIDRLSDPEYPVDERIGRHFRAACDLAERAAREALDIAGTARTDIDGLVCASITGYIMPGLDVELINRLGLARDVTRLPVTQMGCNGGSWALARAADLCSGPKITHVLVVAADLFLSYIHPSDVAMDAMIYRALMGDAAGACVVHRHHAPGPSITAAWDYTIPRTADIVGTQLRQDGMHIHNSPRLFDAVSAATDALTIWLQRTSHADEPQDRVPRGASRWSTHLGPAGRRPRVRLRTTRPIQRKPARSGQYRRRLDTRRSRSNLRRTTALRRARSGDRSRPRGNGHSIAPHLAVSAMSLWSSPVSPPAGTWEHVLMARVRPA